MRKNEEEEVEGEVRPSIHQDHDVAALMEKENRQLRKDRMTLAELFKVGRQRGLLTGITKYGG